MPDSSAGGWSRWTAAQWNGALFRYFFTATEAESLPVTRLAITAEELRRATRDESADAEAVQAAFLAALRAFSPDQFRYALSSAALSKEREWTMLAPPAFVVLLLFTCFAASTMDGDVHEEGDFRERLRILLGHRAYTSYALPDLAKLWRAFQRWLNRQRAQGTPVRELILPKPGWMVRIGHSTRLAFPHRTDQDRLIRLLAAEGFDNRPPIAAVINAVARRIREFTVAFAEAFDTFRAAFSRGEVALERYPFWSAVRDAAGHAQGVRGTAASRLAVQLLAEPDAEGRLELVLLSSARARTENGICFQSSEASVSGLPFVVSVDGARDGPQHAVRLLLGGVLRDAFRELRATPLDIAVTQGVLLFGESPAGIRELFTSRPLDGRIWGLVREDLTEPLLALFGAGEAPDAYRSRYAGWTEVTAFDGAALARIGQTPAAPLAHVRCLQSTVASHQIHISGGIAVAGGYLGFIEVLPVVRVIGADTVTVHLATADAEQFENPELFRLRKCEDAHCTFVFPDDLGSLLEGRFRLLAWSGNDQLAHRRVQFRGDVAWEGYPGPTDRMNWWIEGGGPDMIDASSYNTISEERADGPQGRIQVRTTARDLVAGGSHGRDVMPLTADRIPHAVDSATNQFSAPKQADRLDRALEIFAALASNRKGIQEAEFLERISQILGIQDHGLRWDIARAWLEAGHFDVLTRRQWKGRVYFARDPHLVYWQETHGYGVALVGLTPRALRLRVQAGAERYGARIRPVASSSHWVPPLLSWVTDSLSGLERVTQEEGLGRWTWLRPLQSVVRSVGALIRDSARSEPFNYEARGHWDWDAGHFVSSAVDSESPVQVEWRERSDQPAVFIVRRNGEPFWWSHSRNWALLVAHSLLGVSPFAQIGEKHLGRRIPGQVYLPLPMARWIAIYTGITAGPRDTGSAWRYLCTFRSRDLRTAALALLFGNGISQEAVRRARWLSSVIHSLDRAEVAVGYLPPELRAQLEGKPAMQRLITGTMPIFVIPHIRTLLRETR